MKKFLLVSALVLGAITGSFAQQFNEPGPRFINKAKSAAQNCGCLSDYNGAIEARVTVVSPGKNAYTEVLLLPVYEGPHSASIRLTPLAKVTFYGNNDAGTVECY